MGCMGLVKEGADLAGKEVYCIGPKQNSSLNGKHCCADHQLKNLLPMKEEGVDV